MKVVRGLLGAIALAALSCSAYAQAPPDGSYRQSCSNIRMQGSTLTAICRDVDGRGVQTALGVARCVGDIGNNNGRLQCNGGQPSAAGSPSPGGDNGYGYRGGYPSSPERGSGPGYPPPGYGPSPRYGEGQDFAERCDRLGHEAFELHQRLEHTPDGDEQEQLEHRLREVDYQRQQCGPR